MKATLVIAALCIAAAYAEPAISQARTTTTTSTKPGRFLSLPVPAKCANRPKEFSYRGRNMFLSTHVPALANRKVDWLDGRNLCREYCMDLVALETQEKNNLIFRVIQQNDVPYIWTAGRICDFAGCENRPDLEPKNVYGWFWSATREKIQATNRIPQGWGYNPWSQTGHKKRPQPDNAEYDINQTKEQCLSVLNNVYNDGIAWHDVACYHEKPVICEDNDELLRYVAATNPGIRL
ncbi:uncharacterized protein LOC119661891 [Teleopsis dalmanni]|uniref:uncharacterized protein LOC119661891 n=1 Tax=Teleopsis dalmanni TaxID=139649 RepID=UPI0018CF8BBB|nr:uncharacterized protein LOC119661891 [Teleopsis dalmanni]